MISYGVPRSITRSVCLALFGICIMMAYYAIASGLPTNRRGPMSDMSAISSLYDVFMYLFICAEDNLPGTSEASRRGPWIARLDEEHLDSTWKPLRIGSRDTGG